MAKKQKAIRGKFADEKYLGEEPDLRGNITNAQIIIAYNWYNYFYDSDQAKTWVIEYLKEFHKTEKELIKNVRNIDNHSIRNIGWNCRILSLGGNLPDEIRERMERRVRILAEQSGRNRSPEAGFGSTDSEVAGERDDSSEDRLGPNRNRNTKDGLGSEAKAKGKEASSQEADSKEEEDSLRQGSKPVISIQERIANRANDLIADLETELDKFYRDGTQFKTSDWLIRNDVKPAIAQRIADHYKPLYSEAFDALNGKDEQLKEGYSHYKKSQLKVYVEFLKSIVSAAETRATVMKTVRKPRKKKEKPASAIVSKLKYKVKDDTFKLDSIDPKQIVGCNQLWVFNSKYRTLGVYNAMGPAGLSIKGSTLTGFDEKTSQIKTLRKPAEQLNALNEGGKIVLRKFMDNIKCKSKEATGRINNDTVLLRIIK